RLTRDVHPEEGLAPRLPGARVVRVQLDGLIEIVGRLPVLAHVQVRGTAIEVRQEEILAAGGDDGRAGVDRLLTGAVPAGVPLCSEGAGRRRARRPRRVALLVGDASSPQVGSILEVRAA